jgi:hypothetical protein
MSGAVNAGKGDAKAAPGKVGCKGCGTPLSGSDYDRAQVISREPAASDYFQTPPRVWELEHRGTLSYLVDSALYCKGCFSKRR